MSGSGFHKIFIGGDDVTSIDTNAPNIFEPCLPESYDGGTAMSIEENMAIAARRGESVGLSWGITRQSDTYRRMLKALILESWKSSYQQSQGCFPVDENPNLIRTAIDGFHPETKLLLLDEHTAALMIQKTAWKCQEISDKIISDNHLTAMMVTHNMKDAIVHGNRLSWYTKEKLS